MNDKLNDIEFQKKRVEAREKIKEFKKKQRFVPYITAVFGIGFFLLAWHFARVFYDMELPLFSALCIVLFVLLTVAVNIIAGGITYRSVPTYIKQQILCRKWNSAAAEMEKIEEKAIQQTAFSGDITKAEERLRKVIEEVIERM